MSWKKESSPDLELNLSGRVKRGNGSGLKEPKSVSFQQQYQCVEAEYPVVLCTSMKEVQACGRVSGYWLL